MTVGLPGGTGGTPAGTSRFTTTAAAFGGTLGLNISVGGGFWIGPAVGLLVANTGEAGTKYALHGGVRVGYDFAK